MPETLVLIENTDSAKHIARGACNIERDRDIVHFGHGNMVVPGGAGVLQLRQAMGQQLGLGNFGEHLCQFCLHQLETANWTIELHAA